MPEDLEAAEKAQGVRVESGDILLVRTGYYARRLAEGPVNPMEAGTPALHVACCPWLRERGVAMIGTDTHNDIAPLRTRPSATPSTSSRSSPWGSGSSTT